MSEYPSKFLPTAYEVWGKVMFSQVSVILFTGGGVYFEGGEGSAFGGGRPPPPSSAEIRSTGGRYASCWNEYLYEYFFNEKIINQTFC